MDHEKMLKDIDDRFFRVQAEVATLEQKAAEGKAEMMRLQGECRLIMRMRDEEKAEGKAIV